jgi:Endodeoxyribonuclease RusA
MSDIVTSKVAVVDDGMHKSLSFVISGDPPVQQRPRINFKRAFKKVHDPSSLKKKDWKKSLYNALVDYGVTGFPFFTEEDTDTMQSDGLVLEVVFYVRRRRLDYRTKKGVLYLKDDVQKYPGRKDVDNMLKFVMDASHDVLYDDDKCVVEIRASKKFVQEHEKGRGAYTTIHITTF